MMADQEDAAALLEQIDARLRSASPEQSPRSSAAHGPQQEDIDWSEPVECDAEGSDAINSSNDEFAAKYATSNSQVCDFCEKWLLAVIKGDRAHRSYTAPEHFEFFWSMKKSSQTCGLCWTLIEETEDYLSFSPDVLPWDRSMKLDMYEIYSVGHSKPFSNADDMQSAGLHEFTLNIGTALDDPRFSFLMRTDGGKGSIPQRAIWSDRLPLQLGTRMPVLNEWMTSCDANHVACKARMRDTGGLPTRLIDLFERSHTGVFNPKLILTDQLDRPNIKYTTLSHRWGDVQPVQTFRSNIQDFMKSIFDLDGQRKCRIPRTFHDAFRITRVLGLRYIWIDSICIIQDDHSDWQREASRMADVYRGSFLNIAAIDSPNCNGGCSFDLGYGAMSLTGPNMNGSKVWVKVTPANRSDVYSSQLNTRGWVFQELTLAPRILYCGRAQFYWQCAEKVYSEDGYIDHDIALNIPVDGYGPDHVRDIRVLEERAFKKRLYSAASQDPGSKYDWRSWVRDFSQRSFTKHTDRLPALIGVVQQYQMETRHTFLLGMWEETLIDDLAWRTRQVQLNIFQSFPTERSGLANIPSWTWLFLHVDESQGGIVYFPPLDNRTILTKVEAVKTIWEAEPLISNLLSTKLILQGPLQEFSLQYDNVRRRLYPEDGEERYDLDMLVIRLDETLQEQPDYDEFLDYWFLQLETAGEKDRDRISTFLVLEEEEPYEGMRRFRRVGCGRMEHDDVSFDNTSLERIELI